MIVIGIILESTISGHDNLVGYDQKPRLTPVSGRIPPCPKLKHYIKCFKTPFEAFGQFLIKLSQPLSSSIIKGPKQRFRASNQRGIISNMLFIIFSLQFDDLIKFWDQEHEFTAKEKAWAVNYSKWGF